MESRYRTSNQKNEHQDIYYELTPSGIIFCLIAGLMLEALILFVFGIQLKYVPVFVLAFLWLLAGILVSGCLIGSEILAATYRSAVKHSDMNHSEINYRRCA